MPAYVEVRSDYTLPLGTTVLWQDQTAIHYMPVVQGAVAPSVTIAGTLNSVWTAQQEPLGPFSIVTEYSAAANPATFTIAATGAINISGRLPNSIIAGFYVQTNLTLVNHGLIDLSTIANGSAVSFVSQSDFLNTGVLHVSAVRDGGGVYFQSGGSFNNRGLIEVKAAMGTVVAMTRTHTDFFNSGIIRFVHSTTAGDGVGIAVNWSSQDVNPTNNWTNNGTIQGDIALRVYTWENLHQTFVNNGLMIGAIQLANTPTLFTNTGEINGDVSLGNGGATFDGQAGIVRGQVTGGSGADIILGGRLGQTLSGGGGADTITGGAGDDLIDGGGGADALNGGGGWNTAVYAANRSAYGWTIAADGAITLSGAPSDVAESDYLVHVQILRFKDGDVVLGPTTALDAIDLGFAGVLRQTAATVTDAAWRSELVVKANAGQLTPLTVADALVARAAATTSVATLSYEFFTGKAPSAGGMDYLVSPTGPNASNLNSAYYQSFSVENRYINFAVNLGKVGEGAVKFTAEYGSLSLFDATRKAYATIFGSTPTDTKIHALIDTRADYFAAYGGDGVNGQGTKAGMVGWLLAEAVKADVGTYARSNDAFLTDVALHNAAYGVDLIGTYSKPDFAFGGG